MQHGEDELADHRGRALEEDMRDVVLLWSRGEGEGGRSKCWWQVWGKPGTLLGWELLGWAAVLISTRHLGSGIQGGSAAL